MLKTVYITLFTLVGFNCASQPVLETAIRYFNEKQFDRAKPLFERIVANDPRNVLALEHLGDIAGFEKQWVPAVNHYKKLTAINPSNANYQYKYGGALGMHAKNSNKFKALSMISDVRGAFEKAIRLEPKHIEARYALIELNLQLPAIASGSMKTANRYAAELQKLSPVDGHLAKARIAEYNEDFTIAAHHYKIAMKYGSKVAVKKLARLPIKSNNEKASPIQ